MDLSKEEQREMYNAVIRLDERMCKIPERVDKLENKVTYCTGFIACIGMFAGWLGLK